MARKKLFGALLLSTMLVVGTVFTGCGSGNNVAGNDPAAENNGSQPTVTSAANDSKQTDVPTPATNTETKDDKAKAPWEEAKHKLQFNKDGEFKILVFSDIHGKSSKLSNLAKKNIALLVDREKPDFVIFDGDNTWTLTSDTVLKSCVADMVEKLEEEKIPWCHVFGNHDAEGSNVKKDRQMEIYESFEYCNSQWGDESLPGLGNYVLPVYDSDGKNVIFNVWALDSGMYLSDQEKAAIEPVRSTFPGYANSQYAYISPSQIEWYMRTSRAIEEYCGEKIPSLMAFHIPLQESYAAWANRAKLESTGEKREDVCASEINSGMFAAAKERGDVLAIVNGHDHRNDYMVNYDGIKLCYVSTVSETGYCDVDMLGARVFIVNEDNPWKIDTYMSYVDEAKMAGGQKQEPTKAPVEPTKAPVEPTKAPAEPTKAPTEPTKAPAEPTKAPTKAPQVSSNGFPITFEGYEPEVIKSGWNNNYNAVAEVNKIFVEYDNGKGVKGSNALATGRVNYVDRNNDANNAEIKIPIGKAVTLGGNKYLRVWMDLSGEDEEIDFRKACFGLIANNDTDKPYRTDDLDLSPSPFYYLADNNNGVPSSSGWVEMEHGNDGCFGVAEGSSVQGLRGWFAFPVENMLAGTEKLTSSASITDVYFYYCYSSQYMLGESILLDDITLTSDYKKFD